MNIAEIIALFSDITTVGTGVRVVTRAIIHALYGHMKLPAEAEIAMRKGDVESALNVMYNNRIISYDKYQHDMKFLLISKKAEEDSKIIDDEREPYDYDWFMEFYHAAGEISDEYLQNIWAKILADEVNSSMKYSIRTIDVLRKMDRQDAELFHKISPKLIHTTNGHVFMPKDSRYTEQYGISTTDMLELDDIGLMNASGGTSLTLSVSEIEKPHFLSSEKIIVVKRTNETRDSLSIKQLTLTRPGRELVRALNYDTEYECLLHFCNLLNKEEGISANVCTFIKRDGDNFTYKR